MKKYFLIIGIVEIFATIIASSAYINTVVSNPGIYFHTFADTTKTIYSILWYLVFAPSFGFAFIAISRIAARMKIDE